MGNLALNGQTVLTQTGTDKVTLSDTVIHGPSMIDVYFNTSDLNSYQCITTLDRLTNSNSHGSFDPHGTGMTFNNGIFSFPSTGYYEIKGQLYLYSTSSAGAFIWAGCTFYYNNSASTDNSTSTTGWNQVASVFDSAHAAGGYGAAYLQSILKITDTSQDRFKIHYNTTNSNGKLYGNSTYYGATTFTFIKLRAI